MNLDCPTSLEAAARDELLDERLKMTRDGRESLYTRGNAARHVGMVSLIAFEVDCFFVLFHDFLVITTNPDSR
jgi:hypothetical protein